MLVGCGPAGVAPPPMKKPVAPSDGGSSAASPPTPRWALLARRGATVAAKVGGARVLLSADGMRFLDDGGAWKSADDFPASPLVAAGATNNGVTFVDASGGILRAESALAPLTKVGAVGARVVRAGVSAGAILVHTVDDRVLRSIDGGTSFAAVSLPEPVAWIRDLALDGTGHAVVLAAPQRLFESKDGGVTFARRATRGFGARRVGLDGDALLAFEDAGGLVRLGASFTAAPPQPLSAVPFESGIGTVVGSRWAFASKGPKAARYAVGGLGEAPAFKDLPSGCEAPGAIALDDASVFVRCTTAADTVTFAIMASGAPQEIHRAKGVFADPVRISAGAGAVVLGRVCFGNECVGPLIRRPNEQAFVPVPGVGPTQLLLAMNLAARSLAVIREMPGPTDALFSLGVQGLTKLAPMLQPGALARGQIDEIDGALYVRVPQVTGVEVLYVSKDGGTTLKVLGALPESSRSIGPRALHGTSHLRETLDGGATWTSIHGPSAVDACGAGGCLFDEGFRIGWGGKAIGPTPGTASTVAPKVSRGLRCSVGGAAWSKLGSLEMPSIGGVDGPLGGLVVPSHTLNGAVDARVLREGTPVTTTSLLGPASTDTKLGQRTQVLVHGGRVGATRLTYVRKKPGGANSPVTLVGAWLDDTGKVRSATRVLPPFRVDKDLGAPWSPAIDHPFPPNLIQMTKEGMFSRYMPFLFSLSAKEQMTPEAVDGVPPVEAAPKAEPLQPIHLLRPTGKVESTDGPLGVVRAVELGKRWVLLEFDPDGAALRWSDEAKKQWTRVRWDFGAEPTLALDPPRLVAHGPSGALAVVPLSDAVDPGGFTRVGDLVLSAMTPCKDDKGSRTEVKGDEAALFLVDGTNEITSVLRDAVLRESGGAVCLGAVLGSGTLAEWTYFVRASPNDLAHATVVRVRPHASGSEGETRSATCAWE